MRALLAAWLLFCFGHAAMAQTVTHAPRDAQVAPDRYVVVTIANPQSSRAAAVGGTAHGYSANGGYRVGAAAAATAKDLAQRYSLTAVAEWPIETLQMHCVVYRIASNASRDEVLRTLRADRRVLIAQELNEFTPSSTKNSSTKKNAVYDDPYAKLQENVLALDVQDAHRMSRGQGVRVAVIDTGIDTEHPDLVGRVELVRNYVDEDLDGLRRDRHGTQVAGLIAAAAGNGIGIVGVAPEVKLLALNACWQDSAAASGRCNSFTLAQALVGALAARAQVINLSLVGPSDPLLTALVGKARAAGVIIVGAAPKDAMAQAFPSSLEGVLGVAEAEGSPESEFLRAPGRDIVTLVPQGNYDFASGSSLATAQISGVVALLLQKNRRLKVDELRAILVKATDQRQTAKGVVTSVNACAALSQLVPGASCAARTATGT
jgi:subtilisin family serine protease